MSPEGMAYLASALLGALVGGVISFMVSSRAAHRDRRVRYGERLLAAVSSAQRAHEAAQDAALAGGSPVATLDAREQAQEIWALAQLAATVERRAGRRALQAWGNDMYERLSSRAIRVDQVPAAILRLDAAVYMIAAWTAELARGTDFARDEDEVVRLFGPESST